jgi:hypothetical protein
VDYQAPYRWVLMRLRINPNDCLWASCEDDRGNQLQLILSNVEGLVARSLTLFTPGEGYQSWRLYLPPGFELMIEAALSDLPSKREGPHANGPAPLAIFIELPPALRSYEPALWEEGLRSMLPASVNSDQVQFVHLAHSQWITPSSFRLPLRVLALGERCDSALGKLRRAGWYENDLDVQQYGIHLEKLGRQSALDALRETTRDIVLADDDWIETALEAVEDLSAVSENLPRLIIFLGSPRSRQVVERMSVPLGLSVLWVPLKFYAYEDENVDGLSEFIKAFIYGIIHDYPLHEALRSAIRPGQNTGYLEVLLSSPILFGDPESNNSLRMSEAVSQLMDDAARLNTSVSVISNEELTDFIERIGGEVTSKSAEQPLSHMLRLAASDSADAGFIRTAMESTRNLSFNFQREDWGMAPVARVEAAVAMAHRSERSMSDALTVIAGYSDYVETLRQNQDRRVDVAIQELDSVPLNKPVEKQTTLRAGARYRLRMHIGNQMPDSLVVGETAPIDPLLPELEKAQGYDLEVVLFENDFELLSKRVEKIRLPLLGGSKPIYFTIRAPQQTGRAQARLAIYHENHLLQSFLLDAVVGGESVFDAEGAQVRLSFSRTAKFTNLADLPPRAISIGVNESPGGETHRFMVKSTTDAQPLRLPETVIAEQIKTFRDILLNATVDSSNEPRFNTYIPPGTPPTAEFHEVVRKLADVGNELFRRVFKEASGPMRDEIRRLAKLSDETIQVIRHNANYAFPWTVMYDFKTPDLRPGDPTPLVCMGSNGPVNATTATPSSADEPRPFACGHGPDDRVYCIWGFWGVRHKIEELVAIGDSLKNAVQKITPSPTGPVAALLIGTPDQYTAEMETQLQATLGSQLVPLTSNEDLLDLLWTQGKRPAVLIMLGHMETKPAPQRFELGQPPNEKWLLSKTIDEFIVDRKEWDTQPRTLVLFMACSSGATELATLNDFVTSWITAGSAAIVGTECLTFSRLVARFAREVTIDLLAKKPKSLGDAVMAFNRRMISSGNPLGFVFNSLGDADLSVVLE